MIRKLLLFCAGILSCALAHAAAPNLVNYQGRLTDGSGNPVPDGIYSVTFTVYLDSVGAASVWSETQNITATDGLFAVLLGSVTPFTSATFSDSIRYLGIKVGVDPEITPRSRLASVPFAIQANNNSGWVDDGPTVHLQNLNDRVGIGLDSPPLAAVHLHDPYNTINGVRMALTQQSTGTGIFDGLAVIYGSRFGLLWNYENGPLLLGTANTEAVRIDSLRRVGIGTAVPESPLVVQGLSYWGVAEMVGTTPEASIGFRPSSLSKGSLGTWVLGVNNNGGVADAFSLYAANGLGAGSQAISVLTNGRVGIGSPNPSGALDVASTTGALIVPRMTTAQRDAFPPVNGMIIYNTTTNQFNFRENGAWVTK